MGIRLDPEQSDAQGFPVVSWEEDRNLFAPEGISPARIACFIRPDAAGVLQFVSAGLVRDGAFEEARPWEKLVSFTIEKAEQLYNSASDRILLDVLASKSKSGAGRLLATDGAVVILANFADERRSVPMHLNCAECTPLEAALLHDRLRLEFLDLRAKVIADQSGGEFIWPKDRAFVAYDVPVHATIPRWKRLLVDLSIAVGLGVVVWGAYELVVR